MSRSRHAYRPGDEAVPGYRLIESLGRGNFGEVWLASAPGGMEVALKVIDLSGREGAKEFEALQRVKHIHHPNLVPVFASWLLTDDGQVLDNLSGPLAENLFSNKRTSSRPSTLEGASSGRKSRLVELIIAMGLGSRSLASRLEECLNAGKAAIPRDELIDYMEGSARGIDYLNQPIHDLGEGLVPIIHGDIKPHNILIVGNAVQVCDFGLARAIQSLRKTSTGMGTFAYAAPELLEGKASLASDQYCLAITYIELCTGDLPFSETNALKVVELHRRGELDLSSLRPREREVIRRGTAVDPALRWPSCSVMVRAIRRACEADEADPGGATMEPQVQPQVQAPEVRDSIPRITPSASISGTLVVPPTFSSPGRSPEVRTITETAPLGSVLTARPQPQRKSLRLPTILTALSLLLVAAGVAAYFILRPSPPPLLAPEELKIEQLVQEDKIGLAFSIPETLSKDETHKKQLVEYAIARWKNRIEKLAGEGNYDKAVADMKDAPPSCVQEPLRRERNQYILDSWSKHLDASAENSSFLEDFAEYVKVAARSSPLGDDMLSKLHGRWSGRILDLSDRDQFDEAIRVWKEAPDSVKSTNPERWNEPLLESRQVWADRIPKVSNEHAFKKAIKTWEDGYSTWREDEQGKKLIAEVIGHWTTEVTTFVDGCKFTEAFEFLQRVPPSYDKEKKLRQKVVHAWSDYIQKLGNQHEFSNAFKVLEDPAVSVSTEERAKGLEDLKDIWSRMVTTLGDQGNLGDALQALDQAHRTWADEKSRLFERLRKSLLEQVDGLLDKEKFLEALELMDKAPKKLADFDVDSRRKAIGDKWLIAMKSEKEPQKVVESCDAILKYYPDRAPEVRLIEARVLVRLKDNRAEDVLNKLSNSLPSKDCQPLFLALKLINHYRVIPDSDQAKEQTKRQLAEFKNAEKRGTPPEPWRLDKEELDSIKRIEDELASIKKIEDRIRDKDQTPSIEEKLKKAEQGLASQKSTDVDEALKKTGELLQSGKLASAHLAPLYQALGEVSSKTQMDQALTWIRVSFEKNGPQEDGAAALGKLWKKRIEICIKDKNENVPQIFSLFNKDWEHLERQGVDVLVDVWRMECLLEGGNLAEIKDVSSADKLPKNLMSYGCYVRARCLKAIADRDGNDPNWTAIAEWLAKVFEKPGSPEILEVPNRREKAVALAIETANKLRLPTWSTEGPLDNPFAGAKEAELCCQLLTAVYALDPKLLDNKSQIMLTLAAIYKQEPDHQQASTLTPALANLSAELVNLSDKDLGQDAIPFLYSYLRLHVAHSEDPQAVMKVIDVCTRFCNLLLEKKVAIVDKQAKTLYEQVLHPVELLADKATKTENEKELSRLVGLYDGIYQIVSNRKNVVWPEDRNQWLEGLLTRAIETDKKLPAQPPPNAPHSPKRYLDRAQLRLNPKKSDLNIAGLSAVIEDAEQVRKLDSTLYAGHGLACQAYLLRSRTQPSHQQQLADLTEAIKSGQKAIEHCPAGAKEEADYVLNLSCVCVERANCDKANQVADLKLAREMAVKAASLMKQEQGWPDFPYLAMGNAYEDLAWLSEVDPENNYPAAIKAFETAAQKQVDRAQAHCSIGRCYYKMVADTCLYPGVDNQPKREQLIEKSREVLEQAAAMDPNLVEAHFDLGRVNQYEQKLEAADKLYEKASSVASNATNKAFPSRAMYTARWAQFPLENSTLDAAQQSANALERSKVLLQLPTPPGESLNPLNEEAYIRAEVESRKGNAAAAKGICDVRLPALGRAGTAEVTLLLARSRYEIKLAGNKGEKENAIAMAKMAIDDATRASDIALLRDTIAGARSLAALARFKAYEISNNSEYFDKAREDIKAVILLAPRRSATADLCGWGADKLLFTKCESLPADKLAAKFDLVSEAIDWQNKSCVWGNVSNLQNRRQDYLVGFLRLGVKQCSSLLDQPPSAAGKKKYLEETGKWKEILLKIPERASKRAELAAELGELEQKLNKKLNEAEPQQ